MRRVPPPSCGVIRLHGCLAEQMGQWLENLPAHVCPEQCWRESVEVSMEHGRLLTPLTENSGESERLWRRGFCADAALVLWIECGG